MTAGAPLNIVNLIDSPGHVDFSGEVEAALRICDGAVVVVDVVEGVCVQTVTVLRAALEHSLRPILVLNKIDRLFAELHLEPMEAYRHIVNILEQVNVIMGVREVEEMMAAALDLSEETADTSDWKLEDKLASTSKSHEAVSGYFSPELGNVVFSSATDGWAFRIVDFARLFSQRFGISEKVLTKTLWGDYYLHTKSKRITRKKASEVRTKAKPMFVQFILTNIHAIYEALLSTQHDHELTVQKRQNFVDKLKLNITNRDLKHRDANTALHAIMNAWLPAASCLMNTVIEKLPNAKEAQAEKSRLFSLWPHAERALRDCNKEKSPDDLERGDHFKQQYDAISTCCPEKPAPMMAFVAKMIDVGQDGSNGGGNQLNIRTPKGREELEALRLKEDTPLEPTGDDVSMIALTRIISGTLSVGDLMYVYSPKYAVDEDGSFDEACVSTAVVTGLFLLMGRGTDPIQSAGAGAVVGIRGLDDVVLKTATLSSERGGHCLPSGHTSASILGLDKEAVMRVAVEPNLAADLGKLQNGLRRLNQADPAVETFITAKGEHVIAAHGELHLERCLKDLRDVFAKDVEIHVSKPIVSFRETVCGGISANVDVGKSGVYTENDANDDEGDKNDGGGVQVEGEAGVSKTWDKAFIKHGRFIRVDNEWVGLRITAAPLPEKLSLEIKEIGGAVDTVKGGMETDPNKKIENAREKMEKAIEEYGHEQSSGKSSEESILNYWKELLPKTWACGWKNIGGNLLVGLSQGVSQSATMRKIFGRDTKDETTETEDKEDGEMVDDIGMMKEVEKAIIAGFHLGIRAGPLCEEPVHGVGIFIDELQIHKQAKKVVDELPEGYEEAAEEVPEDRNNKTAMTGIIMASVKEGVRLCIRHGNCRLLEGMLDMEISVPNDLLGKTYTVIAQRRGRVLDEDMKEGVNVFGIKALLPVAESFGFTDALRKHTSGFAIPQMVFSHWEMMETDPFFLPQLTQQDEDDELYTFNNLPRNMINMVKRRKGIKVHEKLVEKAEKQRTLSRKK